MATVSIDYKNVKLVLDNQYELCVSADLFNGLKHLGNKTVIVNIKGKTKIQIQAEAAEMFKNVTRTILESIPETIDIPSSIPDFKLNVEYNE